MLLDIQKYNLNKLLEKYSFEHLRPPPEVMQIIIPENQLFRDMGNGEKKRHIFWKVEYNDKQNEAIEYVKQNLHRHCIMEKFSDQVILKHLYVAKFDYDSTFQRLLKLQEYHTNKIVTKITRETITRLESGSIYSYGFDKQMRPVLIVRADILAASLKQNKAINFKVETEILKNFNCVYYLLLIVMNFKMLPYHNEKYVTIMDFNDMDFGEIPFVTLFDIFSRMNIYYCGNSHRSFLYNSKGIEKIWNVGKTFVSANALKNIYFIEKGKESKILEHISGNELQKKYGGQLQNLTKYWPPQSTNASFDQVNMSQISEQTAFYSVQNNTQYFIQTQEGMCGQNCQCKIY